MPSAGKRREIIASDWFKNKTSFTTKAPRSLLGSKKSFVVVTEICDVKYHSRVSK